MHFDLVDAEDREHPGYLSKLANLRWDFKDTVLIFKKDGHDKYYKFLFAKQTPQRAHFRPLELAERTVPVLGMTTMERQNAIARCHEYNFHNSFNKRIEAHNIEYGPGTLIDVLPCSYSGEDGSVFSDMWPVPFEDFVDGRIAPKRRKKGGNVLERSWQFTTGTQMQMGGTEKEEEKTRAERRLLLEWQYRV